MNRLLLLPLTAWFLAPMWSLAAIPKLTYLESRAAGALAFVLCKVNEGASKEWADNEIKNMSKEGEIDLLIFKRKNVRQWAKSNIETSGVCNVWKNFKSFKEYKSHYSSAMDGEGGEIAFNRLTEKELGVLKITADSECLFRLNKITSSQKTEYLKNGYKEIKVSLDQLQVMMSSINFFKAYKWYFERSISNNCK